MWDTCECEGLVETVGFKKTMECVWYYVITIITIVLVVLDVGAAGASMLSCCMTVCRLHRIKIVHWIIGPASALYLLKVKKSNKFNKQTKGCSTATAIATKETASPVSK